MSLLLTIMIANFQIIYINPKKESQSEDGSLNFPFSSLDYALELNNSYGETIVFLIISDNTTSVNNITNVHSLSKNTTIRGKNQDETVIFFNNIIKISNFLFLSDLTIKSELFFEQLFVLLDHSIFKIQACIIRMFSWFVELGVFITLAPYSNLTIESSHFVQISNPNISIFFKANCFSSIIILNSSFTNISIETTQLIVSNYSYIQIIETNFNHIYSLYNTIQNNKQSFISLINSQFIFCSCFVIQSFFYSFSFIIINHDENNNFDKNLFLTNFSMIRFYKI